MNNLEYSPEWIADILIVDDKVENIRFLSEFLSTKNYQVRKAINGKAALNAIDFSSPDLVLLDINMPEMGGYEVCKILKEDPKKSSIPIIFLSAGNSVDDKIQAFEVGGVDYITKPFQLEEVLARIESQLTIKRLQRNLKLRNQELENIILNLQETKNCLEISEKENQALFNAMNELVIVLNYQGFYQKIATKNIHLMNIESSEAMGKNIYDILPKSEADLLFKALQKTLDDKVSVEVEYCLNSLGKNVDLCAIFSPIAADKALCVIRDISQHKQREKALKLIVEGTASKTGEDFFRSCVYYLAEILGVRYAFITKFVDEQKTQVETLAFWKNNDFTDNISYYLEETPCYAVINEKKSDCYHDHVAALFPNDKDLIFLEARSYAGIPLINSTGEVIGHIAVLDIHPMEEDETRELVLQIFGARAGAELERQITDMALKESQEQSERLLLNLLPATIAQRLKHDTTTIAESYNEVTILFADLVGFTQLASQMNPIQLVNLLNDLFSTFDELSEKHGLEKIKTIGDAYMVVGGLPTPRVDHAEAVAEMALDMQNAIAQLPATENSIKIRIGINSGPVVAGVIGVKKFIYDLWGDAVNIASRMESSGEEDKIQVTDVTYQRLKNKYQFKPRGIVDVKGRGKMMTYWLLGDK